MNKKKEQSKLTSFSGYRRLIRKGQVFPFLDLPAELRLHVYEHAVPDCKGANANRNVCNETGIHCRYERKRYRGEIKGFVALLCTNKLIYKEAVGFLYRVPKFPLLSEHIVHVSDTDIHIRGYNLFCLRHHVFEKAEALARFRFISLHVHAYCSPWKEPECDHLDYG